MGYKLAGYTVRGCCEIDPQMMKIYKHNLNPPLAYEMDVRDLPTPERVAEIGPVDILDGSPPCSTFSMAGQREKGWGVEKQFREGQKLQRLDDLFFAFIDVAKAIRPKVVVAENVKGIILGDAKGYAVRIVEELSKAGYDTQVMLLNASQMGVPQSRERVFFISRRKDLRLPPLKLAHVCEPPIPFGKVRTEKGVPMNPETAKLTYELMQQRQPGDGCVADISQRVRGKWANYNSKIQSDDKVAYTITANASFLRMVDADYLSTDDFRNVQTFPQDYDFMDAKPQYVCGMSVPPVMMAHIAKEIEKQWLKPGK